MTYLWSTISGALATTRRRQWQLTPVLLPGKSHGRRRLEGCSPWGGKSRTRLSDFTFTFHFHALEKEMATHSSVLAWRIPGKGEPGGLPSMGSHRVGHDWSDLAAAAAAAAYLCVLSQILTFSTHVRKTYHWEPRREMLVGRSEAHWVFVSFLQLCRGEAAKL